jgi:hypothetical protein
MRYLSGRGLATLACVLAFTASAAAQSTVAPQPAVPADAASMDAIVKALYDGVSHAPGKDGDWAKLRAIFAPGARLTPPKRPTGEFAFLTPEEFIDRVSKGIASRNAQGSGGAGGGDKGFSEREVARRTDCFGNVCQLFSTYESRYTAADPKPFTRGINSIQLLKDGNRWWIANVVWDQESEGKQIPAEYLPKS